MLYIFDPKNENNSIDDTDPHNIIYNIKLNIDIDYDVRYIICKNYYIFIVDYDYTIYLYLNTGELVNTINLEMKILLIDVFEDNIAIYTGGGFVPNIFIFKIEDNNIVRDPIKVFNSVSLYETHFNKLLYNKSGTKLIHFRHILRTITLFIIDIFDESYQEITLEDLHYITFEWFDDNKIIFYNYNKPTDVLLYNIENFNTPLCLISYDNISFIIKLEVFDNKIYVKTIDKFSIFSYNEYTNTFIENIINLNSLIMNSIYKFCINKNNNNLILFLTFDTKSDLIEIDIENTKNIKILKTFKYSSIKFFFIEEDKLELW